jgi:endosialidase-like protein
MRRSYSMLTVSALMLAIALFGISRDARAQDYTCGTTGSPYSGTCYAAITADYNVSATFASTVGVGVYGVDTSSGQGVQGFSSTSAGVFGGTNYTNSPDPPSGSYGVYGTTAPSAAPADTGSYGVFGYGGTGSNIGVYGLSGTGSGVYGLGGAVGVHGVANASGGYGVQGAGVTYGDGVHGTSDTTGSSGVAGINSSTGNGAYGSSAGGYGVYGTSSGDGGVGGYFTSPGVSVAALYGNATATGGCGVLAEGPAYGIWGQSSAGYAGYFDGVVDISDGLKVGVTCEFGSCSVSDRRLKKNIEPLKGALDSLLKLKGVTFEWNAPDTTRDGHGQEEGTQTGFIAQQVEPIFSSWVGENAEGFKTLNIPSKEMAALTVEAFRELNAKSDKQQAQIDKLIDTVDRLQHGRDPISRGPGFGTGVLALFAAGFAGATVLMMKRLGLSLAMVVGLLIAGRKKNDEKRS